MYKKIILCLLFPFFSNNENLCAEPCSVTEIAAAVAASSIVVYVALNAYMNSFPTPQDELIAIKAKLNALIAQKQLDYLEARDHFRKCAAASKPADERTVHGIPVDCRQVMLNFALCGGEAEAFQIMKDLDEFGV